MSVYVDDPETFTGPAKHCNLTADTHDELMKFANRLGMYASELQTEPHEHFKIPRGKRITAIKLGAIAR